MEKMDAGAWCAGLPMARWSKCYYPTGVIQLFGEGPQDVVDGVRTPIVTKKRNRIRVLYFSLAFMVVILMICLMVFFIVQLSDTSLPTSDITDLKKSVILVNARTPKDYLDVAKMAHSLERTRWLTLRGKATPATSAGRATETPPVPNNSTVGGMGGINHNDSNISEVQVGQHQEPTSEARSEFHLGEDSLLESSNITEVASGRNKRPLGTTGKHDAINTLDSSAESYSIGTAQSHNQSDNTRSDKDINNSQSERKNSTTTDYNAYNLKKKENRQTGAGSSESGTVSHVETGAIGPDSSLLVPGGTKNETALNSYLAGAFYGALPLFNKVHDSLPQW